MLETTSTNRSEFISGNLNSGAGLPAGGVLYGAEWLGLPRLESPIVFVFEYLLRRKF